jgi:hypothetical protein
MDYKNLPQKGQAGGVSFKRIVALPGLALRFVV